MPIHDWTRVNAGLFHHFRECWIVALCDALNASMLPPGSFALIEQTAAGLIPDVLTLQYRPEPGGPTNGGIVSATTPPRTRYVRQADADPYVGKANRIAVRHRLGHVVAVVEIVSPGNKGSRTALRNFVEKAVDFLRQGVHLLVIDLFPPPRATRRASTGPSGTRSTRNRSNCRARSRSPWRPTRPARRTPRMSSRSPSAMRSRKCRSSSSRTPMSRRPWARPTS